MSNLEIHTGDCIEVMRSMPDNSVGSIVTDPPYGLEFMGRSFDSFKPRRTTTNVPTDWYDEAGVDCPEETPEVSLLSFQGNLVKPDNWKEVLAGASPSYDSDMSWKSLYTENDSEEDEGEAPVKVTDMHHFEEWNVIWLREAYRILKPGGVIKIFNGTRTYHRVCSAVERVGFEIEDLQGWIYSCLPEDTEILTDQGWVPGVDVQLGQKVMCWDSSTDSATLLPVEEKTLQPYEGPLVSLTNNDTNQLVTPNHRVYARHRQRKLSEGYRKSWYPTEFSVCEAQDINRWNNLLLPIASKHAGPGVGDKDFVELLAWVWTEGGFDKSPGKGVRIYQSSVNMSNVERIQALLSRIVPERHQYTRERKYKDRDYTEYCWYFSGDMADKVRRALPDKHPTWEFLWTMSQEEKALFMEVSVLGDGSVRSPNSWAFYQKYPPDLVWFQTLCVLCGWQARILSSKSCVLAAQRSVTELQRTHLKKDPEIQYQGNVWCVTVPTGAFFARRLGKVFITGNSGFPKSMNIGKALEKSLARQGKSDPELVEKWKGFGTALKPAHEPVICARKPLAEVSPEV